MALPALATAVRTPLLRKRLRVIFMTRKYQILQAGSTGSCAMNCKNRPPREAGLQHPPSKPAPHWFMQQRRVRLHCRQPGCSVRPGRVAPKLFLQGLCGTERVLSNGGCHWHPVWQGSLLPSCPQIPCGGGNNLLRTTTFRWRNKFQSQRPRLSCAFRENAPLPVLLSADGFRLGCGSCSRRHQTFTVFYENVPCILWLCPPYGCRDCACGRSVQNPAHLR